MQIDKHLNDVLPSDVIQVRGGPPGTSFIGEWIKSHGNICKSKKLFSPMGLTVFCLISHG